MLSTFLLMWRVSVSGICIAVPDSCEIQWQPNIKAETLNPLHMLYGWHPPTAVVTHNFFMFCKSFFSSSRALQWGWPAHLYMQIYSWCCGGEGYFGQIQYRWLTKYIIGVDTVHWWHLIIWQGTTENLNTVRQDYHGLFGCAILCCLRRFCTFWPF